jgi:hypothetical protein
MLVREPLGRRAGAAVAAYRVTLSVDGKHGVSVSSEDPTELGEAIAWAGGSPSS